MKDNTKIKIAKAAKELMRKRPLEKISVTEIVDSSGVSRQTFYRKFQDKYDLVNWYFDVLAMQSFVKMNEEGSLRSALISKFDYIRSESGFFKEAFKITGDNSVVKHDYEFILEFYMSKRDAVHVEKISSELAFLMEFYCHASISMTVEWALKGMQRSSQEMADLLISAIPEKLSIELAHIL